MQHSSSQHLWWNPIHYDSSYSCGFAFQNATANITQRVCDHKWRPDAAQCSGTEEKKGCRLLTAPGKVLCYHNENQVMVQTTPAANK